MYARASLWWWSYDYTQQWIQLKQCTSLPKVIITEITSEGNFYAQSCELGTKLEGLMERLHQEFKMNQPLAGSYTARRGAICAARFTLDDHWYRAKIERVIDQATAQILYIDYGNREVTITCLCLPVPNKLYLVVKNNASCAVITCRGCQAISKNKQILPFRM